MNATSFIPRPAQQKILAYEGGPMGISAVPGSGKTFTLSLLAAQLVERLAAAGNFGEREVLIVTMTNSAVENFRSRIGRMLREERGLLPGVGYRVRTLHGLAHDIVRERPGLVGLHEGFAIVDDRTANDIKRELVLNYLRNSPDTMAAYIDPDYLSKYRSIERYVQEDAVDIANHIIRIAKERRWEPYQLQAALRNQSGTWPLLEMGAQVYAGYQRSLMVRGAVDFSDLIVLALRALDADPGYLERLQTRWPYVLEDEAQDSSLLQETMLRRLTAMHGNWVRVGDPNQAINTTFTGADIRFLNQFMQEFQEQARTLPNSGRSAQPIIDLANAMIRWSRTEHPVLPPPEALALPEVEPTPPGDPQPNPEPGAPAFYFHDVPLTPEREVEMVVKSLAKWLPENPHATVGVLVPENQRGFYVTAALEELDLPFDDSLLRTDTATRAAAAALATTLSCIVQPQAGRPLEQVWREVWWPRLGVAHLARITSEAEPATDEWPTPVVPRRKQTLPPIVQQFSEALRQLRRPEQFIFPGGEDWLDALSWLEETPVMRRIVQAFRADLQRWMQAAVLPVDELIMTLGNELFSEPSDLALTYALTLQVARADTLGPQAQQSKWDMDRAVQLLESVAENRIRVADFSEEGGGFDPVPGKITVGTMHQAKGLEWDRVYLMAVNNYSFPSGSEAETYRSQRFYARDGLNLAAEAIDQVQQLIDGSLDGYAPGPATETARRELAGERLRLLYVGITRARRELILTYNTGRNYARSPNEPAAAFQALKHLTPADLPSGAHAT